MERAKIPTPVRLEDADEARKAMYGGIANVRKEFKKDSDPLPEPVEEVAGPGEEVTGQPEAPPPSLGVAQDPESSEVKLEISDDDKHSFVRSILGGRAFSKTYVLFDVVKATFTDRTPDKTLSMYEQAKTEAVFDTPEWTVVFNKYYLASTLTALELDKDKGEPMGTEDLKAKIEQLKKLPRPLYLALLDAADNFERLVDALVDKAQDRDFWKAGGST
jgi:hypothetical protein